MQKILSYIKNCFIPIKETVLTIKERLLFIDLYRGWAIIIMIETHVVNQFLSASFTKGTLIHFVNFINGMVAPSFLFISGFSFLMTLSKKFNVIKVFKKIFFVLAVAYALHMPHYSLKKILFDLSYNRYIDFIQSDVLNCIAAGWLLLLVLKLLIKNEKAFIVILWILGSGFVFAAPFIWNVDFGQFFPLPIETYFNTKYKSLFPIFPWIGFMIAGALTAHYFFKAKTLLKENRFMKQLTLIGSGLFVISLLIFLIPFNFFGIKCEWGAKPYFFAARLGIALIFLSALFFYEKKYSVKSRIMLFTSREALGVYVWHLIFLYTIQFGGKPLGDIFYKSLNVWQTVFASILLIALMIILAIFWNRLKARLPKIARLIFYGFWVFFIWMIIISPN